MLLSKIVKTLEDWCPLTDAEEFDNVGLLVGDQKSEIKKAIITLDITDDIIDECISSRANLIISSAKALSSCSIFSLSNIVLHLAINDWHNSAIDFLDVLNSYTPHLE